MIWITKNTLGSLKIPFHKHKIWTRKLGRSLSKQMCTVYPKKYAHGFCFVVLCCGYTLTDFPISIRLTSLALWQSNDCPSASKATSGSLHWHCGNLTIAPVPAKQPWWIWINTSCEFIMNDCITTTKQSTTKPCAYFLGYTVDNTTQSTWATGSTIFHNWYTHRLLRVPQPLYRFANSGIFPFWLANICNFHWTSNFSMLSSAE